jgi:DNA-directed RNA polymerase subunit M/transcription elongation factor TFIIS
MPEHFEVEGVGRYQQPRCPKCNSPDIAYEDLNRPVALTGLITFGIPVAIRSKVWKCDACGHQWREPRND